MRRYCKIQILFGALFIAHSALGQTAEEMATRRVLLNQAREASNASDHAQALSLAARAAEIQMTPSLRLFIAQQQSMVGQLGNAIANAELCAREATEDQTLKNRKEILGTCMDLAAELQQSAARIVISWPEPAPPHAQVLIDGQVVPESFYGRAYTVSPGAVRVAASAPGHLRFQSELQVAAQQVVTLTVALPEEPGTPRPVARSSGGEATVVPAQSFQPAAGHEVTVVSGGAPRPVGAYVVLGAGAASLGASAAFLILRNNAFNKLDAQCGGQNHSFCTDTADVRSLKSKASTYNVLTDVALGVGSAAVVGGAIWLFYEKARGARAPRQAELQITPTQGGAMVGIGGAL